MSIAEVQLDTWSHQGSVTQSAATYQTIKTALERTNAPYANQSYSIFLQGSYSNDTNIYADSDVDVVMSLDSVYYSDKSALSETELVVYNRDTSKADYNWQTFRQEIIEHLTAIYGNAVESGKKAVFVSGSDNRRDVDVLPAAEFRRYLRYSSASDNRYIEGICFWLPDGTQIKNYPKQHSANCTLKHQRTDSWFKPMVRIFKNMRNIMVDRGQLPDGLAPSYFIEGMLYNVPNSKFGSNYADTFAETVNWLLACDPDVLVCANEMDSLLHPISPVNWRRENLEVFLKALVGFWNRGG